MLVYKDVHITAAVFKNVDKTQRCVLNTNTTLHNTSDMRVNPILSYSTKV